MASQLKILVCGDVNGKFNQLFNRITSIQKKAGKFDMLFCVGNFFSDDKEDWVKYQTGGASVPIATFILGPNTTEHLHYFSDHNGEELCDNVTYLGKKGIYTSTNGLVVAYIGGQDGTLSSSSDGTTFTNDEIDSLIMSLTSDSKFKGVDILLTSQWTKGVEKYASQPDGLKSEDVGSGALCQVALALKPRYHFCGLENVHYERQPYRNHKVLQESARHVTRYISLASVGNPSKKKFLYAFNISPMKYMDQSELTKTPEDATECPYKLENMAKSKASQKEDTDAQFFYDQKSLDRGQGQNKRNRQNNPDGPSRKKHQPRPTGPCWFCLGSPEVEKHLVVSVGEQCYVALAKGGLTPDHVLICPIGHHQSLCSAPDDVIQEINKYKASLTRCLKSHGKAAVFFERNYKTQHLQIQVVPVPLELADEVKETFQGCALSQNIELHEIPKHSVLKEIVPARAPFFYAEMPTGEKMLYRISKGFPLQFGREAMCHDSLLNMPLRVDWRNCKYSKDEENDMASKFKQSFQKFDFNFE